MLHAILFIVYFKILRITLGDAYEHWAGWLGPPAILLTIGAAALAHHVVELPCRRFFGRPDLLALGRGLGRGESALGRGEAPGSSSGGRR
jgi:peptidoglycan/LPS O-acetylase OafA/YrhL